MFSNLQLKDEDSLSEVEEHLEILVSISNQDYPSLNPQ